jgi:glycine/D-amino acid oxidase-like deaminating enzyme
MVTAPFWDPPPEKYPGRLPDKADVLVIGGGIAGVSLLFHLARRRIDAVLVERSQLAAGASGRNAGFLLAGVATNYADAVHTYGRGKARDVWELTNENHDRMIEAVKGQDVGYRRLGSVILPSNEDESKLLIESSELLQQDGFQARWDGTRLINPRDGELDPAALVAAIARQMKPGSIREGVDVVGVQPRGNGVLVTTSDRSCEAGVVILATNAYTPQLVPSVKIEPTRAQMLATEPETRTIVDRPTYSHFGYRYWRQLPTGEVLVGGWRDTSMNTELTYVADPTPEIQDQLDTGLAALGVDARVTHRWAGIMGFTESGLPLTGSVDGMRNTYICAGFTGHGMGFAFVSAKQVAEMI